MDIKHFFIQKLSLFFMLTTLITAAVFVIGSVFDGEAKLGYDALLSPMLYAACCVIPTFVTYSKRELRPGEMTTRMVLELVLIEAVILGLAFRSPVIDTDRVSVVLAIAGSVLAVYVLARLLSWVKDSAEARKLNDELLRFQQSHEQ